MELTANKIKWVALLSFIILSFNCFSQKDKEFTFSGPQGMKGIMNYVTNDIRSEDTLKPVVCFYIFKLNAFGEISEIENLCKGYSYLSPQLDSILISKIYSSKIYWIGSSDKSDYRWVILPIFLGNPPKTTISSGGSLFFSIREQIATIVQKFNYQMDKVIWIHPRFTMLGIEEKL